MKNDIYNTSTEVAKLMGEGKQVHGDIIKHIEKLISDKDLFNEVSDGVFSSVECNAVFTRNTYTTSRNNVYKMYEMNEGALMLLAMQLSKYRIGRLLQHDLVSRLLG